MLGDEEQIPSYSLAGRAALDIFYVEFHNISFYVEDAEQENLYKEILKRTFPQITIERIFPLGGKQFILKHSQNNDDSFGQKSVYIVDKDFDDFLGKIEQDERIFYLERYCIENYLIEENSIIEIAIETRPKEKPNAIREHLKISTFISENLEILSQLFNYFLCVQEFELGIKNCKCSTEDYSVLAKKWCIDTNKVDEYWHQVKQEAVNQGKTITLRNYPADYHKLVSGKFLITLIFHYINSTKYKMSFISIDSFVYRVAKNCSLDSFQPVANRIKEYIDS